MLVQHYVGLTGCCTCMCRGVVCGLDMGVVGHGVQGDVLPGTNYGNIVCRAQ